MVESRFVLSDETARQLAKNWGTPLYVVSETAFRSRLAAYRESFAAVWPETSLSFASKSNSTLALLRIAAEEGYSIDVASEGELRAAILAGVPTERCHLHGNAKTDRELEFALASGVGQIMVDNFEEIRRLSRMTVDPPTQLILRLAPGVDPKTHAAISTGQSDTKFGFNIANGDAERALLMAREFGLPVVGFHCHVGSQLLDPQAQIVGGVELAQFAASMKQKHAFECAVLNVGGGLGVRYLATDLPTPFSEYCRAIVEAMRPILDEAGLRPRLEQEPGRSVIAEAGVTLYEVLVRKTVPSPKGEKTYLSVDGGLSDNPRSVMYGAKYDVRTVGKSDEDPEIFTVSGKHCETDTLFADVSLASSTEPGDLLQVLCTGAYNASMASNYNRFLRPAAVMIAKDGEVREIQRRETWQELFSREEGL